MSSKKHIEKIERDFATSHNGGKKVMFYRRYLKRLRRKWLRKQPHFKEKQYRGWEY